MQTEQTGAGGQHNEVLPAAQRNEVRASADLASYATEVISRPVQETHRSISRLVFGAIGPVAKPVQHLHDAISDVSYSAVREGVRAIASAVGTASEVLPPERKSHVVTSSAAGSLVVGAVNGLLGHHLAETGSAFAVELGPHFQRKVVSTESADLAMAHPLHTDHVVVFVHGLGETEQAWWYRHEGRGSHGEHLATLGATPVLLRYNTGLSIEENGATLSTLLDKLLDAWPMPIRRMDLVGHSMGGLVLRYACREGSWLPLVKSASYLGTPHDGAPLALGAHHLARGLNLLPASRPWGDLMDIRSRGIDDLRLVNTVPLAVGIRHVAVIATVAKNPDSWWARKVGDAMVPTKSARGPIPEYHVVPGVNHLDLLTHQRVREVLADLIVWDSTPAEVDRTAGL